MKCQLKSKVHNKGVNAKRFYLSFFDITHNSVTPQQALWQLLKKTHVSSD